VSGLPHGIEGRRGSLLNLPAADGQFDAALAVESLEHALLAQRAVDELCRVVRPGGSILIIDKDLARQGLSEHEPWEQWFAPHEVAGWLSRHCTDVAVRQVCHVPAYRKRPLFLAWTARRSGSSIGRSIAWSSPVLTAGSALSKMLNKPASADPQPSASRTASRFDHR
jgi:SAM-dependent methyltransferase